MRKIFSLSALVAILLFTGCLYQEAADWQRCTFKIASIEYVGIRENQTEWQIVLNVHNPGSRELKMERVRATALLGADTLAILNNSAPLDLMPNGDTKAVLKAYSTTDGWNKALASLRQDGKCSVTLVGDAEYHGAFGLKKYPGLFHKTYDLDLATALNAMGSHLLQGMQGLPFSF